MERLLPAADGRNLASLNKGRPYRLSGLTDEWPARAWDRETFLAEHGHLKFRLRPCATLHQYGYPGPAESHISLADYLAEGSAPKNCVLFENDFHAEHHVLQRGFRVPELLADVHGAPIFSVGCKDTGVGFHRHKETWLAQLQGRKLWLLIPGGRRPPALPPWRYLIERPSCLVCCVLHPGEVMFLPTGWWHATWNLDEFSLAVGWEGGASSEWSSQMHAIADGDVARLASLAEADGGLGEVTQEMVELAARGGHVDVLEMLDGLGGREIIMQDPAAAAVAAARGGHIRVLDFLARRHPPSFLGPSRRGACALHEAARCGSLCAVRWLVAQGADCRLRDGQDVEPLHVAAGYGQASIVDALLRAVADPNSPDGSGSTPLLLAAFNGHVAVTERLFAAGARTLTRDGLEMTALHLAALRGHAALVPVLVAAGVDVAARDSLGRTSLHLAAYAFEDKDNVAEETRLAPDAHLSAVVALLRVGADARVEDSSGLTPAQYARGRGHHKVAELLQHIAAEVSTAEAAACQEGAIE